MFYKTLSIRKVLQEKETFQGLVDSGIWESLIQKVYKEDIEDIDNLRKALFKT